MATAQVIARPTPHYWPAPAKLNLFLHITGRREDGYHLLQTLFQLLEVGDELRFAVDSTGRIQRDYDLPGIAETNDIILRAAQLLQTRIASPHGVRINLTKRLPIGGGLGGGSSDAATTLVALNHLWRGGLSLQELAQLGLSLGADVPVFIHGRSSWAEGIGEHVVPVDLSPAWYVVLIPPVAVSTAEVFSQPQLRRDCPAITIRDFLAGQAGNVCEAVVCKRFPPVAAALEALSEFARARLTGTGACVFASFPTEDRARLAWKSLADHWQGFVARGVNQSPLHEYLATQSL
ncbi:MAG: 4-(cytidine 5'-diphospho)-2-C-methyl-D-erythritol kinase [Gammaproteobacteria bacterium]|nr:4-(cytidine 5'-diphospho)-2-C-methyl-D-erythritol kinase [Gammaproteobacteria bacterium]